jgi:hypothetical protein
MILQRCIASDFPRLHSLHSAGHQVGEVMTSLTPGTIDCQSYSPLPRIAGSGEGTVGGLSQCPPEKRGKLLDDAGRRRCGRSKMPRYCLSELELSEL